MKIRCKFRLSKFAKIPPCRAHGNKHLKSKCTKKICSDFC